MRNPISVVIYSDGGSFYLRRPGITSMDRDAEFIMDVSEIDKLIQELTKVRTTMARNKRETAKRLLREADNLDPQAVPA